MSSVGSSSYSTCSYSTTTGAAICESSSSSSGNTLISYFSTSLLVWFLILLLVWFDTIGVVSTLAGSGTGSYGDGVGVAASFFNPRGVSVDSSGTVYVGDSSNNRIRKISSSGYCTPIVLMSIDFGV